VVTDPDAAITAFDSIRGYLDSGDRADQLRYEAAEALLLTDTEAAIAAFEAIGSYADSANRAKELRYAAAETLAVTDWKAAAEAFEAIGGYLDSTERANKLRYDAAEALAAAGDWKAAAAALESLGQDAHLLTMPNDILATEYCKAILAQGSKMEPMVIRRQGGYHDTAPDSENPSATAVRELMLSSCLWLDYVPQQTRELFRSAVLHTRANGERAILARLRTMSDEEFEALPYGSEGLWRKLMKACRKENTLEDILTAVKSKRYTRTRLDRIVMCAFLGLTQKDLAAPAPYTRVLALNDRGRQILKAARSVGSFPNIGEKQEDPYQSIETRCGRLYGLFAQENTEQPDTESQLRIYYHNQEIQK